MMNKMETKNLQPATPPLTPLKGGLATSNQDPATCFDK